MRTPDIRSPLRPWWYHLHWIVGLTAGMVLGVMGLTGFLLAFEDEVVHALNPAHRIATDAPSRPPDELIAAVKLARAEALVLGMSWPARDRPVEVRITGAAPGESEVIFVDPRDATLLATPGSVKFFHLIEDIHRNLAAGETGKRITGIAVVLLLAMMFSGVALRWSGAWRSPKYWLGINTKLRGRALLRELHTTVGTWLLACFLITALTGFFWSFETYRVTLQRLAGVEQPAGGPGRGGGAGASPPRQVSLNVAWDALRREVPDWRRAMIQMPRAEGAAVDWRYLAADAPHERAFGTLRVNTSGGEVVMHEPFAALNTGRKGLSLVYPLHTGSWAGWIGRIIMALAALLMPCLALSGAYLWWRKRFRRA